VDLCALCASVVNLVWPAILRAFTGIWVRGGMMDLRQTEVSGLLAEWSQGSEAARDQLMPLVYDELRRLAAYYMARENSGHTLQATALVNEAYVRLADQRGVNCQSRAHFFALASCIMRRILVDHARKKGCAKRGGHIQEAALDEAMIVSEEKAPELIALDEALTRLAAVDPRKSQVVELRYFGGLNVEEAAEVLKISAATVRRDWSMAKAWLHLAMNESGGGN
jgi:RNA polymerase sigma-70 factor, ECF subfamily